jgi:hypothetical protein
MRDSPDSVEGSLRIDTNLAKRCEKAMQLKQRTMEMLCFHGNQGNDAMKKCQHRKWCDGDAVKAIQNFETCPSTGHTGVDQVCSPIRGLVS